MILLCSQSLCALNDLQPMQGDSLRWRSWVSPLCRGATCLCRSDFAYINWKGMHVATLMLEDTHQVIVVILIRQSIVGVKITWQNGRLCSKQNFCNFPAVWGTKFWREWMNFVKGVELQQYFQGDLSICYMILVYWHTITHNSNPKQKQPTLANLK